MSVVKISAWARHGDHGLVHCEVDDKRAERWDVHYPGAYCGMPIQFENKSLAERIAHALETSFEAGKKSCKAEFRAFIHS